VVRVTLTALLLSFAAPAAAQAEDKFIIVQSTTSTQNSGLFEHILPSFTKNTGSMCVL
jgi:tungstate transport system substrate-binding protein